MLLNKVKPCGWYCKFCNAMCQKGQHPLDEKHSCDVDRNQAHHLRAFASGLWYDHDNRNDKYPSLYSCNMIKNKGFIYIDDKERQSWGEIQDIVQPDFEQAVEDRVAYKSFNNKLKKVWKKIG